MASEFAVYLPAVNLAFAKAVMGQVPRGRMFPAGLTLDQLAFWSPNPVWHYPNVLYSLGAHSVGADINNGITCLRPKGGILVFDSGGFQIAKGTLKGGPPLTEGMSADAAIASWRNYGNDTKSWVTRTSELHAKYAMTLDIPPWTTLPEHKGMPFNRCSFEELLSLTLGNLRYIDTHRGGRVQWINVVHGMDPMTTRQWWQAVKWFPCGGYSMAGAAGCRGGLFGLLNGVLPMLDDGAFEPGRDILHVLGTGTIKWAILLTAIQRRLRDVANPNLQVTFDSSTAFQEAGAREKLLVPPHLAGSATEWSFGYHSAPQGQRDVDSLDASGLDSPIGQRIRMGDLSIQANQWCQRKYDAISAALISHHSVWTMVHTFDRANALVYGNGRERLPNHWREAVEFIEDVIGRSGWAGRLVQSRALLDAVGK